MSWSGWSRVALLVAAAVALPGRLVAQADRVGALTFETSNAVDGVVGWNYTAGVTLDSTVVHGGRYAARIHLASDAPGSLSILSMTLPRSFDGDTLELRGWIKTEEVGGFAGLWLREDGRSGPVQFDNMQDRHLAGTTEWTQHRIRLPLDDRGRTILLGALLAGGGTMWVDDLELLVDGVVPEEAPAWEPASEAVSADTAFDHGSGIPKSSLSDLQTTNLTLLGKVWGFAKYNHPRVTGGEVNWDYELFRVLPEVLAAPDRASAASAMAAWLGGLGPVGLCSPCAATPAVVRPGADDAWAFDPVTVGPELGPVLAQIHQARPHDGEQYYVGFTQVGNPDFSYEAAYADPSTPDAGYRLLALYRLWNIIQYWFPYRDLLDEDWGDVLAEFVPRVMFAEAPVAYRLVMLELVARIHDTHANLWSDLAVRPPRGDAMLPVVTRFVEGRAVVTGYSNPELGPASGLRPGDVILALDGEPVDSLVHRWTPYYADSNEAARLRDMGRMLTRGGQGPVRVRGERASGPFETTARRVPVARLDARAGLTHDLPGDAFQRLTDEVAYLKLSSVKTDQTADYLRQAAGAEVLVVDIRNYPSEFVVFSLGGHLVREPTPFVRFTHADPSNPGAFVWTEPVSVQPLEPFFGGKVVILVDEVSQSQAEYTAMALRAAPGAIVVGSTTAGADGNVSPILLPGGLRTMISGIGVFYPDGTPTQRVGIVPDLVVTPTIDGIRAGRDEVLEAGVSRALGRPFRLPAGTSGGR